jgi:hypothetical protein
LKLIEDPPASGGHFPNQPIRCLRVARIKDMDRISYLDCNQRESATGSRLSYKGK